MDQFIVDQLKVSLKEIPRNLAKSFFISNSSFETASFRQQAGGFIRGVCHPSENYEQMKKANIEWVRFDIPFPFEKNGEISESFLGFKARCEEFRKNGMKIMAVTPYPYQFLEMGIDPVTNEKKVTDTAVFITQQLKDCINALQITNEMGIPRFTIPLSIGEAARFIGIQAKAISGIKGDILIGYNSAGPQTDLHVKMLPFLDYIDYVGVDIYMGCFYTAPGFLWVFDAIVRYLWALTKKPIMLQEFGYISLGAPKTKAEKQNIIKRYGADSVKQAKAEIEKFIDNMPGRMKEYIRHVCPEVSKQAEFIFRGDFANHLYCELPRFTKIPGMPHTPEGQAKFFTKLLPRLYKQPFMGGAIIYCYSDSDACYVCGQQNCPTETAWGLVDLEGKPKPSYYAVQTQFGVIERTDSDKKPAAGGKVCHT